MKMKNILKKDYTSVAIIGMLLLGLSGCTKDPSTNHKPVVTVPSNKIININESLILTATASDKDKEDELTYLWTITAKPEGSKLTLSEENATKRTISVKADKLGTYYFDFIAQDEIERSKAKRVTVTATSIIGEWTANLSKTKEENKLNKPETNEVVEALSSNYKLIFLDNGKIESNNYTSWKYNKQGNYIVDDGKKLKQINENQLYIVNKLEDGKEIKFYYKRVLKNKY